MNLDARWRRSLALAALCEGELARGYLGRSAALYGWGIPLSYGVLVVLAPESAGVLVRTALLGGATVVGVLVALASIRSLLTAPGASSLRVLSREHGFDDGELLVARAGGALFRMAKAFGAPALALGAVTLAATWFGGGP